MWRSRWAAVGAAIAVTLGAGGIGLVRVSAGSNERPVTVTIEPERILDTRTNLGLSGRFDNGLPRDVQVTGSVPVASGGVKTVVPAAAIAVLVNVTVVLPDSFGHLALRPAGAVGEPSTSTVNFQAGSVEPNAATVDLGPGGAVQAFLRTGSPTGTADVLLDVVGYTVNHTHDDLYVSSVEDTFFYVPGSMLDIHYQDGPATVLVDNSGDAIVRKTGSTGSMQVIVPIPIPAERGGQWARLENIRVSYQVANANSYISHTWLTKSSNTGANIDIIADGVARKSTAYTSYVLDCVGPDCQLSWVPNGNYLTVGLMLNYSGIGSAHDIHIGGVLLRVSYEG